MPKSGALILAGALLLAGCARTTDLGPVQTEQETIAAGDAQSAGVEIRMGAGELNITAGTTALMEAGFTHNAGLQRPEVTYAVSRGRGSLVVRQRGKSESGKVIGARGYHNKWDLALGGDIPLDVKIELGAGVVNLKLARMMLNRLDISFGAASGKLDLSGDWDQNVDVAISGGVGSANLRLPSRVGVRVEVEGGLGAVDAFGLKRNGHVYTNDAYGLSPVTMKVHLEAGIGSVNLELVE